MASAWIYQDPHQVRDKGEENASWVCGWYEPDGRRRSKSFGPGSQGKKWANQHKRKVEAQLMTGTYNLNDRVQWDKFRKQYEEKVVPGCSIRTRKEIKIALNHFEKTLPSKTMRVYAINTGHVDHFISRRREDRGLKRGDEISPATINKDLRHIKAALAVAMEWGYLKQLPRFRMEKVPKKLPVYVTGEHFAAIYQACDTAKNRVVCPSSLRTGGVAF